MTHAALPAPRPLSRWICHALVLASLTGSAAAADWGPLAARKLGEQFAKGDCSGAVEALNAGLANASPKAYLLAGSMYEHGVCVKRDWNRAVGFYAQAHDGGEQAAALRLASGFAAPENGPDIAAALWWAGKARLKLLDNCGAPGMIDPDLFVEQLRAWSKPRLEQCNYAAGVMASIAGEVRYPSRASSYGLDVDMTLRFLPAVPTVQLKMGEGAQYQQLGRPIPFVVGKRNAASLAAEFEYSVRDVARRALSRYPQPAGIDPKAAVTLRFEFRIED